VIKKPFFEKYLPYLLFVFIGYCLADVLILNFRDLMLPSEPPPAMAKSSNQDNFQNRGAYQVITTRNIFSSDGVIPEALVAKGQEPGNLDNEPVPSNLPLTLKGTIVHSNPAKSIATIEVKSKSLTNAYPVGVNIENLATLEKVERRKIIIRNLNNRQLEFIEMKDAGKLSFGISAPPQRGGTGGEVAEIAPNKFEIKRSVIQKYTSDMASVLQQAAMAPRRGANGEIECFKFLSIQPGSIYTELKFQNGDCISGVNGEKIDSPAKAMEMYNAFKNSPNLKLQMERDGRPLEYDYIIK
jgi:general secretion pathway protein C